MFNYRSGLILFLAIFIYSCSSGSEDIKTVEALPLEKTVQPDTISIEPETEFFNLRNVLNVNDEYLVFVDEVDKGVFKIFSLPDLEFQYAWGRMGRGPDELSFISLRQINAHNDKLVFYEDVYARLRFYQVADSALVLFREQDDFTFREKRNPINGLTVLQDSLYIIDFGFGDLGDTELKKEFIALEPGNPQPLFTFGTYPSLDLEPPKRMQEYSKVTAAKPDGSRLAAFYRKHNKFKIFDDEGTLLQEVNVNDPSLSNTDDPEFIFRIGAGATDQYIFTLAVNNTEEALQQNFQSFKPSVEVWSWSGEPVQRFQLDHPIARFAVSESFERLYGLSFSHNNKIYEYNLGKIIGSKLNKDNY